MTYTLAIDCMGGDLGPSVIVSAALSALESRPELSIRLVGPEKVIASYIPKNHIYASRLVIEPASEVIDSNEKPSQAIRSKRDSSMRVALELVSDGLADACVSSGNTGALMGLSMLLIRTITGIDRPAILAELPNIAGETTMMLDLGANVDASAEQLFSFGLMGHVLSSAVDDEVNPRIALLNIGEESNKGRENIRQAAEIFETHSEINYVGYIEANRIYSDDVDVIVCDGFTGNNVLKASEGVSRFWYEQLKSQFMSSKRNRVLAFLVKPVLKSFKKRINPDQYNGASLLGLREIVVKSHGSADEQATLAAIYKAIREVEREVPAKIEQKVSQILLQNKVEKLDENNN